MITHPSSATAPEFQNQLASVSYDHTAMTTERPTYNANAYVSDRPPYPDRVFEILAAYHQAGKGNFGHAIDLGCGPGEFTHIYVLKGRLHGARAGQVVRECDGPGPRGGYGQGGPSARRGADRVPRRDGGGPPLNRDRGQQRRPRRCGRGGTLLQPQRYLARARARPPPLRHCVLGGALFPCGTDGRGTGA